VKSKTSYILNTDPLALAGSFGVLNELPPNCPPLTLFFHNPWYINPIKARRFKSLADKLKQLRNIDVVFCTNQLIESLWMKMLGSEAYLMNQNLHVCESIYNLPDTSKPKLYDAVYVAALEHYKRIPLARKIKRLNLVTYKVGRISWDVEEFLPSMTNMVANSNFLSQEDVVSIYHQSHAGLALSAIEGSMFASMEYMLSGLPVVSTRSLGGRSHYGDSRYWITVNANARSVHEGVMKAKSLNISATEIRSITLSKIKKDRKRFAKMVLKRIRSNEEVESFEQRIWGNPRGIHDISICTSDLVNL
jgi:glycosyltransferase involved in cell wall biosynthesis